MTDSQINENHGLSVRALVLTCMAVLLVAGAIWVTIRISIEHPKPLRVGYKDSRPYMVVKPEDAGHSGHQPGGLAVDVITEAARRSGQIVEWVPVTSGEAALRSGKIDLYPLLTVTPNRISRYHFSEYWWHSSFVLVSMESASTESASMGSISEGTHPVVTARDTAGKRVGVRTVGYVVQLAHDLFPAATVVKLPRMQSLWEALCTGKVDAFFVDGRSIQSDLLDQSGNVWKMSCGARKLKILPVMGATLAQGTASTLMARNRADLLYARLNELLIDGTLANLAARYAIAVPESNQHLIELLKSRRYLLLMKVVSVGLCALVFLFIGAFHQMRRAQRVARDVRLALEESEGRFHAFMDHSPVMAFMRDQSGHLAYVNNAYCRKHGTTLEEGLGKSHLEIFPADIAEQLSANDRAVLEANTPQQFTETVPDSTGRQGTWLSYKFPFHDRSGRVFLGGVAVEITEMVAAQEKLRESEARYRQIVDFASDIIVRCDRRGRITYCNDVGARILKVAPDRINGIPALHFVPADGRHRILRTLLRESADGTCDLYLECPVIAGDGSQVWLGQNIRILRSKGMVCGFQAISRDITVRKKMEAELRESEERFRVLYENGPVAYHEIDCQGIIQRVNHAECELLGRAAGELIGCSVVDLIAPEDREAAARAIDHKVRGLSPLRPFERTYIRPDGRRLRLDIHENLLQNATGQVIGLHSVLLDITQRHLAELLDRDRGALSEMIARQSPLDAILSGISGMIAHQNEELSCIPLLLENERLQPAGDTPALNPLRAALASMDESALSLWPMHEFRVVHGAVAELSRYPAGRAVASEAAGLGLKSCWSVPIVSSSYPLGVLLVFSPRTPGPTIQETRLLEESSRLAGIAVEHRHMTAILAFQARHDCLTGLPNRNTFENRLEESLTRGRRTGSQFAIFYIDLDRFKAVNDTYGHTAGDNLLQQVANRIRSCIRDTDMLARIGGDEFMLLLDGLNCPHEANRVAMDILRAFQQDFDLGEAFVNVTPSIGISFYPDDGDNAAALQRNSDIALYQAKNAGRNGFRYYALEEQPAS